MTFPFRVNMFILGKGLYEIGKILASPMTRVLASSALEALGTLMVINGFIWAPSAAALGATGAGAPVVALDGTLIATGVLAFFVGRDGRLQAVEEMAEEVSQGKGEGGSEYEYTWDENINATQEPIEGTNIPKSFTIKGMKVNGKEVWVHGNATKHMGEYVNSANGSAIVENELMTSFQDTLSEILPKVQSGRNFFKINGWEIGINGDTGVVYHALYK